MTTDTNIKKKNEWKTQQEKILTESRKLFWEKGYAETSMRDIANSCKFRPSNTYNFFKNKETILFEILKEEMLDILIPIRHLKDNDSINPEDALYTMIKVHLTHTLGEMSSSKLLFDVGLNNLLPANRRIIISLRDEYDDIGMAIIKRGIAAGIFSPVDEKITVYSIASIIARSRIWFNPKGKYSIEDMVTFVYNFSLNGIRNKR